MVVPIPILLEEAKDMQKPAIPDESDAFSNLKKAGRLE